MKNKNVSTIVLDVEQGYASDVIQILQGEEDPIHYVADINLQDDDQISIGFGEAGKTMSIWIPLERVRKLLEYSVTEKSSPAPRKDKRKQRNPWTAASRRKISESMKKRWKQRKDEARSIAA